jgi:hypothetical protein
VLVLQGFRYCKKVMDRKRHPPRRKLPFRNGQSTISYTRDRLDFWLEVPELTGSVGIKLNRRVSLWFLMEAINRCSVEYAIKRRPREAQ